jgi:transposase
MGLIAMSERDLQRIEILSKVVAQRMTTVSAAHVLDLSERQVRRLLERMRTGGAASIRHKAIGRPSNNRISDGVRDYAMTLVRERYADFGPTLATEKLAERDGLRVSRETVRNWMADAGLWLSVAQAAADVSSAAAAARSLWRAGADRRVGASLVRGSRTALLATGVCR